MHTLTRILLFVGLVVLAVSTGNATTTTTASPATVAAPRVETAASHTQAGHGQHDGQPQGYTCTSASSCAVLAAALGGGQASSGTETQAPQPRAHRPAQRRTQAQYEDQPGWSCATQGNHVCGNGVAGGPLADDSCPAGGVRVYGTPHGCRYR